VRIVPRAAALLTVLTLVIGACTAGASPTPAPTATPVPTPVPTPTPNACAKDNLQVKVPGKLPIGTDNPAFPPWFGGEPPADSVWQVSDPTSGMGYESAFAYALAAQLGFAKEDVGFPPPSRR
jgi:polar amino acid transport system substrate-binding protein